MQITLNFWRIFFTKRIACELSFFAYWLSNMQLWLHVQHNVIVILPYACGRIFKQFYKLTRSTYSGFKNKGGQTWPMHHSVSTITPVTYLVCCAKQFNLVVVCAHVIGYRWYCKATLENAAELDDTLLTCIHNHGIPLFHSLQIYIYRVLICDTNLRWHCAVGLSSNTVTIWIRATTEVTTLTWVIVIAPVELQV